jgi:hypothetical protein
MGMQPAWRGKDLVVPALEWAVLLEQPPRSDWTVSLWRLHPQAVPDTSEAASR